MQNDCVIVGNPATVFIRNQQHHNQNFDVLAVARDIKGIPGNSSPMYFEYSLIFAFSSPLSTLVVVSTITTHHSIL